MQVDETSIKVLARFTAELISEMERRPRGREMSWPAWFAAMHDIDFDNPPFADGRHLGGPVDHPNETACSKSEGMTK